MKSKQALLETLSNIGVALIIAGAVSLVLLGIVSFIGLYDYIFRITVFGIGLSLISIGYFLSKGFLNRDMAEQIGEIRLLTKDLDKYIEELAGSRRLFNKVYSDMEGVADMNISSVKKLVESAEKELREIVKSSNDMYLRQIESSNTKLMESERTLQVFIESIEMHCDDLFRVSKQHSDESFKKNFESILLILKRRIENTGLVIIVPEIGAKAADYPHIRIVREEPSDKDPGTILDIERIGFVLNGRPMRDIEVVVAKPRLENEKSEQIEEQAGRSE
ncbi:MAG TPA: nucleotide exchange factor GrpE [Mesotoga infera]|uniref:nucleotide exchange factor GrpE n=1 Tax=Mesotoga prima TaxID=1184387 RepID=UPI001BCE75EC|nr:nucleotide exchange factor GrpE [Mesotoga prima]HPD39430.1 nucleotide exchange factor GrpE [Mesotoga infera]HQC14973.1 nucleotide exchange factor GrpE [Mesotoga prima]HRV02826.1 nucleotide exchange factor GrpE [Mesotoga sp.]